MNEKILIIDNQYFPCINLIKKSIKFSHVKIESCDTFQKNSFRNRCVIAGSNGLINLSVPVEKGRDQKTPYREVKISQEKWQIQHWRTIVSCYQRAPFFEYYSNDIKQLIFSNVNYLFEINFNILLYINKLLKNKIQIEQTDDFIFSYDNSQFEDARNTWKPTNFQQGEGVRYFQVFEDRIGFQPNLSILDLLFCEGPNALHLLSNSE
ncbi:MAG: WbqC family protein [Filimonas sp.]|nr:WbqC family protein [Filimonas sp.]